MLAMLAGCSRAASSASPEAGAKHETISPAGLHGIARLRAEAAAYSPHVTAKWVRQFLAAADELPPVAPRKLWHDPETDLWYSDEEQGGLDPTQRERLEPETFDEDFYYTTRYGSPISYARPYDLLAAAGLETVDGRRILDMGYGHIGQLQMLARLGADAVGQEVDSRLRALYSEASDQGRIASGSVTLVHGRIAVDAPIGDGFAAIIAKNVLKNGFLHPEQEVDPRTRIDLGTDEESLLAALHDALAPRGLLMIYNITPAPNGPGRPYRTWADGRSPFTPDQLEAAGLRVLAFEQDDTEAVRVMARALAWDQGEDAMVLDQDLFAQYTLLQRR
jgi:hypothetical protein